MLLRVFKDKIAVGRAAADQGAIAIRRALAERGRARIIAASAASQLQFLDALTKAPGIDWPEVEVFHLDEYIGLPASHPASFRYYLMEHLVKKTGIVRFHRIAGDAADPAAEAREVGRQLASAPIDIAFLGIGENGHIAFNDPPADFNTEEPYIIVNLDEACRRQQVGEGWFADMSQVPRQAISMSARQILKATELLARSRPAQSPSREGLHGGRDQPYGSRIDSAPPSQCDGLPGYEFGLAAEPAAASRIR